MKRLSWKYIAGLVDGEGCIDCQHVRDHRTRVYHYLRPRLRIALGLPGKHVLDIIKTNHGGNTYQKHLEGHEKYNPNWGSAFYWQLEGKRLRALLQNIVNHLEIKKEQAKLAIWILDNITGKQVTDEIRERLKDELKAMKRDPQRLSEQAVAEIKPLIR
jgi:hypothetical protein